MLMHCWCFPTFIRWEPEIHVIDGLRETIAYFRHELQEPSVRSADGRGVGGPYGKKIELPHVNEDR